MPSFMSSTFDIFHDFKFKIRYTKWIYSEYLHKPYYNFFNILDKYGQNTYGSNNKKV